MQRSDIKQKKKVSDRLSPVPHTNSSVINAIYDWHVLSSLCLGAALNCSLTEMHKPDMLKAAICCHSPLSQLYGYQTVLIIWAWKSRAVAKHGRMNRHKRAICTHHNIFERTDIKVIKSQHTGAVTDAFCWDQNWNRPWVICSSVIELLRDREEGNE